MTPTPPMVCPLCRDGRRVDFGRREVLRAHLVAEHEPAEVADWLIDAIVPGVTVPCHRRRRFVSHAAAAMALVLDARRPRRPYKCADCGHYHLDERKTR